MNGPEHYRKAEELEAAASDETRELTVTARERLLSRAQIHATLAVAAFTSAPISGAPLFLSESS